MTKENQKDIKDCIRLFLLHDQNYRDPLQTWLKENDYQPDQFIGQ